MGIVKQVISAPRFEPFLRFWKGITEIEILRWNLKSNNKEFWGLFTEVQTVWWKTQRLFEKLMLGGKGCNGSSDAK